MNKKSKIVIAFLLATVGTGCSTKIIHKIDSECLVSSMSEKGELLNLDFNDACGRYARDNASIRIEQSKLAQIAVIDRTARAQLAITESQQELIQYKILIERAKVEVESPYEEATATKAILLLLNENNPELNKRLTPYLKEIGLTRESLEQRKLQNDILGLDDLKKSCGADYLLGLKVSEKTLTQQQSIDSAIKNAFKKDGLEIIKDACGAGKHVIGKNHTLPKIMIS